MKWFEGTIPSAIQLAKSNKSVFIVFITGEDERSGEMELFLHKDDVTAACDANNCVAVKLSANSNDCKFFSQIYPVVVVPSTFLISDTGIPLEVIGECQSEGDFLAKVIKALQMQKKSSSPGTEPAASSSPETEPATSSSAGLPQEDQTASASLFVAAASSEDVQAEDEAAAGSGDDDKTTTKQLSLDERVHKAQQLVEKKRDGKLKQEAEDEKRREIERRNIGQNMQKLKQQQKEMEVLEAKMELKKDKEEDRIARQRVKEEIERDRAEKAARFNKEKDLRAKAAEEGKKKKLLEQQAAQAEEQAQRSDTARIQFRMPDGSSVTQQFQATDTFASVHQFITQHMGSPVTLSMTFPRRTFTSEDHQLTLRELQLAPSAAIMVIPRGVPTSVVRSTSGIFSFSGITGLLFAPVFFLWNMIGSLLGFSVPATRSQSAPRSTARGGSKDSGSSYKQRPTSSRQEGAIRRFHNAEDDESDEDRVTWNGNSTQQM